MSEFSATYTIQIPGGGHQGLPQATCKTVQLPPYDEAFDLNVGGAGYHPLPHPTAPAYPHLDEPTAGADGERFPSPPCSGYDSPPPGIEPQVTLFDS